MTRFFLYLFIICILFSCKAHFINEDNNNPQGYADSQMIGTWKIISVNSDTYYDWNGDGMAEKNIYSTWSVCQKDNLYSFAPDKTGTFKLNCSVTEAGNWQIYNTQFLQYGSVSIGIEYEKIISMTSVQFKTTKQVSLPNGQAVTITKTWSRQ